MRWCRKSALLRHCLLVSVGRHTVGGPSDLHRSVLVHSWRTALSLLRCCRWDQPLSAVDARPLSALLLSCLLASSAAQSMSNAHPSRDRHQLALTQAKPETTAGQQLSEDTGALHPAQEITGAYKAELAAAEAAGDDGTVGHFPAQELLAAMGAAVQVPTCKRPCTDATEHRQAPCSRDCPGATHE